MRGWAPDDLLDSYHAERHPIGARILRSTRAQAALNRRDDEEIAELRAMFTDVMLRSGRGLLLATHEWPALREMAAAWAERVDYVAAPAAQLVDADALLVRPDGHVCWAGQVGADPRRALARWFGAAHRGVGRR